jgi:hypothetical protein
MQDSYLFFRDAVLACIDKEYNAMNPQALLRLARLAALCALIAAALWLSMNSVAWATPGQAPSGQTVPRREPELRLGASRCDGPNAVVEFVVANLRDAVASYGTVTYAVNGQIRTAAFSSQIGETAYYLDIIPPAQQAPGGSYNVTAANVTIVFQNNRSLALELQNPGQLTIVCQAPPQPQPCPTGLVRAAVGPGIALTLASCPWQVTVTGDDFMINGTLEIAPLAPATIPLPRAGETFIGPLADIRLLDTSGNLIAKPAFANPIEICYIYTPVELARIGSDPSRLIIEFFDSATSSWTALPTTLDVANSRVCAAVSHLTMFALAAPAPTPTPQPVPSELPRTGTPTAPTPGGWIALLIGAALAAGLALRLRARAQR